MEHLLLQLATPLSVLGGAVGLVFMLGRKYSIIMVTVENLRVDLAKSVSMMEALEPRLRQVEIMQSQRPFQFAELKDAIIRLESAMTSLQRSIQELQGRPGGKRRTDPPGY